MVKNGSLLKIIYANILNILKEYCKNSSLAGVGYIVNDRLHISERIFWLICIILSSFGSYHLIKDYLDSFDQNAISLVIENISPHDKIKFPAIGVCELGEGKFDYEEIREIVESLKENEDIPYSDDVDQYLTEVIFPNLYRADQFGTICDELLLEENNIKCPTKDFAKYAKMTRKDCKGMFVSCKWNGVLFDCCQYFLPLKCTTGECLLINSIQTKSNKSNRIELFADWDNGNGLLELTLKKPFKLHLLNEEDIPFIVINARATELVMPGYERDIKLNIQTMVNDPGVRNVPAEYRKCIFPDENPIDSSYKYYSFTTCVTDCLKRLQIKTCNCSQYDLITRDNEKTLPCDFFGMRCLDKNSLIQITTYYMQPWRINGLRCPCQPSCNANELNIVQNNDKIVPGTDNRKISITLQSLPTQRYRRQAVRGKLDIVVTVGGILGLFMGASIISIIELIYFLTYRFFKFIFHSHH